MGESVLVRVADDWTIIDSFVTTPSGSEATVPAPIAYLRERDIDPSWSVRSVILSHLHSDHSRGIDEVVRLCEDATFYLPDAVPDAVWREMLKIKLPEDDRKTVDEIASAYRYARDDGRFKVAGATAVIDQSTDAVRTIGPTQRAGLAAREPLAANDAHAARRVLNQNYTSVVVFMRSGGAVALLGADMDALADLGWPRVLQEHDKVGWIGNAGLVKVPHHGSRTAFHPEMYARYTTNAIGIVAPNGSRLPRDDMVEELKNRLTRVFLAGPPRIPPLGAYDTEAPDTPFAIRATHDGTDGSDWQVDLPAGAHQIL